MVIQCDFSFYQMNNSESLAQIYEFKNNDERFLIKNHETLDVKIRYLDDVHDEVPSLQGGARRRTTTKPKTKKEEEPKEITLYPALTDVPNKDIKDFISVCHLEYIASSPKSNSIFIIPDAEAMKAIKADIKAQLGGDPTDETAVKNLKSKMLLYKHFILDTFGKAEHNASFEYRIPYTYPDKYNEDIIYRRCSRFEGEAFYVKLEKNKCSISLNSDMSNSVSCKYITRVGNYPNYVSFAFQGNILALLKKETKNAVAKKTKARKALHMLMNNFDSERAAYEFVGAAISSLGADKCLPYYSANMLQTAFALTAAFGDETVDCSCDPSTAHRAILKMYKPTQRRGLSKTNISKLAAFGENCLDKLEDYSFGKSSPVKSSTYFRQIKNGYKQIANDLKNDNVVENEIAGDVAYGMYDETNNVKLALDAIDSVKGVFRGHEMNDYAFRAAIEYLENSTFKGLIAQQYFPMLSLDSEPVMKGGADVVNDDVIYDLEFDDE